MTKPKAYAALLLSVAITNLTGYLLRAGGFSSFIILAGFRLHIAAVVPFLACLIAGGVIWDANIYRLSGKRPGIFPFIFFLLPAAVGGALYAAGLAKPTSPDYLIEFGASSLVDYPVYFFWNVPQLLLIYTAGYSLAKQLPVLLVVVGFALLPVFEFLPFNAKLSSIAPAAAFVLLFIPAALAIRQHSPWKFAFIVFTAVWGYVLVWGSTSETIIQLFFARTFSSWEGVFTPAKSIAPLLLPVYAAIALLCALPAVKNRQ